MFHLHVSLLCFYICFFCVFFTEGSDPVAADPFTINGDVTAQLYHHPVIENMMDRWAAVTTSDCEPIYDSNAYFGTDYLGRGE